MASTNMASTTAAAATTTPPSSVSIRSPSKYAGAGGTTSTNGTAPLAFSSHPAAPAGPPPIEWLHRTWCVTHSTLAMWRSARNVRITYRPMAPKAGGAVHRLDDLVEYEALDGRGGVKSVAGVDTAVVVGTTATETTAEAATSETAPPPPPAPGEWDWRGKGLLFFVSSHWEVLGWGERPLADGSGGVERWAVTWFAKTIFSQEGVDIYSDRPEGGSPALVEDILAGLKGLDGAAAEVARMVERDMVPVAINLPWKET